MRGGAGNLLLENVIAQGSVSQEADGELAAFEGQHSRVTSATGEIALRASEIRSMELVGAAGQKLTASIAAAQAELYVDHDADVSLLLNGGILSANCAPMENCILKKWRKRACCR